MDIPSQLHRCGPTRLHDSRHRPMCSSEYNELVLQQVDSQRSIYSSIHKANHKSIDRPFHLTFHLSITFLIITVRRHVFVFRLFYTYLSPRIVTAVARPIMTYGSQLWAIDADGEGINQSAVQYLETVQNTCLRGIIGAYQT
ncbi:hypothetical protein K402DRAFT_394312 [Aulographum hederae CBS 113979]|uniref:Uncharacterized protein n=1 Tax=Aulographum hederae CBS 113979 TaxID=1176131 RepID=A0A6G1GZC5_9PEZI|nr:hypothetical protein K402DRAFT_394312 [Aulographum hederae CBS 113979]